MDEVNAAVAEEDVRSGRMFAEHAAGVPERTRRRMHDCIGQVLWIGAAVRADQCAGQVRAGGRRNLGTPLRSALLVDHHRELMTPCRACISAAREGPLRRCNRNNPRWHTTCC